MVGVAVVVVVDDPTEGEEGGMMIVATMGMVEEEVASTQETTAATLTIPGGDRQRMNSSEETTMADETVTAEVAMKWEIIGGHLLDTIVIPALNFTTLTRTMVKAEEEDTEIATAVEVLVVEEGITSKDTCRTKNIVIDRPTMETHMLHLLTTSIEARNTIGNMLD